MVRITRVPGTDGVTRLHVAGRVAGDGATELGMSCDAYLVGRHPLVVDVSDVSFVDEAGLHILKRVVHRGGLLTGCSPFLSEMLDERREER